MTAPTFSERDWATRKNGDFFYHSESMFEAEWPGPASHFGLGVSTEDMATYKMSPFTSHAPDYIAALTETSQPVFVEVQGTGMGGASNGVLSHKFKAKKLEALGKWNSHDEVTFWLWEDFSKTYVWTSYASVRMMIHQCEGVGSGSFDGKRPYWSIDVEVIQAKADTDRLLQKYG